MKTKLNVEVVKEDGTKVIEEKEYDLIDEKEEVEKKKVHRQEFEKELLEDLLSDKKISKNKNEEQEEKPLGMIKKLFLKRKE